MLTGYQVEYLVEPSENELDEIINSLILSNEGNINFVKKDEYKVSLYNYAGNIYLELRECDRRMKFYRRNGRKLEDKSYDVLDSKKVELVHYQEIDPIRLKGQMNYDSVIEFTQQHFRFLDKSLNFEVQKSDDGRINLIIRLDKKKDIKYVKSLLD